MGLQSKKLSGVHADNDDSNNNYYEYDMSDGEGSAGSHGLNDLDDSLYFDQADVEAAKEKARKNARAQIRAQKKEPKHGGGLEALFSQPPPPRVKSIGIHGEGGGLPAPRHKPAPPLRTRSGGIMKLNRKISRTVTDAARTVVDATSTVAEVATSVARGREDGASSERPTRSNSLGALSRKFSSRVDRGRERKAKQEADGDSLGGGMMNLNLGDDKIRTSSIGALSKRARRSRFKSVDDAEDLLSEHGEMELNEKSPLNSPTRERRAGSVGPVSTKARRERWKSVDDAEDLLDAEGEFEMKLDDSPKTTPKQKKKKRSNSVGAVDTKSRRERKKSVDSEDLESRSKSREGRKKGKTRKAKKRSESRSSDTSDDDSSAEKRKPRKGKKRSESRSSDSSDDESVVPLRRKASKDNLRKKPSKTKKSSRKLSADDDPSEQEAREIQAAGGLDLGGGQVRGAGRRMGRRSSLGGPVALKQQEEVDAILRRTQQADQQWDASKTDSSVIERRVRRRASMGADEAVMALGARRMAARKKSMDP
ncbi:unnamed protein product [Cylindrotheca closterium]|uniref:Uncharacterized protein n=1 Tax=Cylindrotheca closterium TaxID=2856 RepID=A0AAD2FL03_9STRA|nr:unnamed protein product [Cylindrotheca closterium]